MTEVNESMSEAGEQPPAAEGEMRPYTTQDYIRLVESISDEGLQEYMQAEKDFVANIPDASRRTLVDLGAGYGRVLDVMARSARNAIGVELNPDMLAELQRRAAQYPNVSAVGGYMQELPELLDREDVVSPVLLSLQNTLGTIEGDYEGVLNAMRSVAKEHGGAVVLSLFRQGGLRDWGVSMYEKISDMVGTPDLERIDFDAGLFVTTTGYTSTWWRDSDIEDLIDFFGGNVAREVWESGYALLQLDLPRHG